MSLNESIVEDAALEWFLLRSAPLNYGGQVGEQCRVAPTLIPAFSQREKGKEREAIRRLNPEIFSLSFGLLLHLAEDTPPARHRAASGERPGSSV